MFPFSTLLRYDYFSHAAALCLLFTPCCAMTTFTMMLHYVYFFNAAALYLYFFHDAPLYIVTPFSTLLRYDCCFHAAAAMSTFSMMLTMSTFSKLLRYVYVFHALFPMLLDYVYFIHAAQLFFHAATLCLPLR